jgi:hypothetical protein
MATKSRSKRSAPKSSAQRTPTTAKRPRTAAQQQADQDRIAAEHNRENAETRVAASSRTTTDGKTVAQHSEHPENPKDSTVRHSEPAAARQDGTGEGGFPQGEYDVTDPVKAGPVSEEDQLKAALTAHYDGAEEQLDQVIQDAIADSRLDESEFLKVMEALPVGCVIEHEGPNRWRCHKAGQNRFGHGTTALQAVENYVLGDASPSAIDAAARTFLKLSEADQKAIEDRDRIAATRVGGSDPNASIREEARKTAEMDKSAKAPAPNAATDGAEIASARAEQGSRARSSNGKRSSRTKK